MNDTALKSIDFEVIFNQSPISTQILTPDGKTVLVNTAWEKLWGLDLVKLDGYNMLQDKQLEEKGILSYIKKGFAGEPTLIPAIKYEPHLTLDIPNTAEYRWVQARIYPIKDNTNVIKYVVLQHEDITEIKDNEKRLSEINETLEAIINASPLAIYVVDPEGNIQLWNEVSEKMFGWKKNEIVGKKLPIVQENMSEEFNQLLETLLHGKSFTKETVRQKKDGTLINVSISAAPVYSDEGEIISIVAITTDISERRINEQKLQHYARLVTSMSEAIIATDMNYIITSWNKGAEQIYGFTEQEVVGKPINDVVRNEFSPGQREEIENQFFAEGYWEGETIQKLRGDKKINARSSVSLVQDTDGTNIGIVSIMRDITKYRQTSIALKESEERLRLALIAGKIGVWDWDIQENTLAWTPKVYDIHGVNSQEFVVTIDAFEKLIHSEDKERVKRKIDQTISTHAPFEAEFRIVTPSGDIRWVTTSALLTFDEKGKAKRLLGATTDITERKNLEKQKDEFIAIASHELKTPITSVKAFGQVLQNRFKKSGDTDAADILKKMDTQFNKLTALIQDLLNVTKLESGQLQYKEEKYFIDNLIAEIVEEIQHTTDYHKIQIQGNTNAIILGDRDRVGQVIINFLTNAIKYSPNSNKIIVRLSKNSSHITCEIQDFGIGIPEKKQQHVFERFYRVDEDIHNTVPGIGLGLYISSEIIKRQNGTIGVKSQLGKGTTFYFSLPISP